MHDDQHGTAIVVLAALIGATKVLDRDMSSLKVVISGAGAAGVACANILLASGVTDITVLDSQGIVHTGRDDLNPFKAELAARTNPRRSAPAAWPRRSTAPTCSWVCRPGWCPRS